MKRWEQLEGHLTRLQLLGVVEFNSISVAEDLGIGTKEASGLIAAYLAAQRKRRSDTMFVLHRSGRTSRATWRLGFRTADVRQMNRQTADDFKRRIEIALRPDLERMAELNPRAVPAVNKAIDSFAGLLESLGAVLEVDRLVSETPSPR